MITQRYSDGTVEYIKNPNKVTYENGQEDGEEISGWGGMTIRYYRQQGFKRDEYGSLIPTYGAPTDEWVISIRDRSDWEVIRDQGIHRIYMANCDAAGNCTEWTVQQNIKIDTIEPRCKNKVTYDDNLNSDGGVGPNSHGWLYDEQEATVSHDCADSSSLNIKTFDKAFLSIDAIRQPDFNIYDYKEFGSGCAYDPTRTNEQKVYSNDIYTCVAGTRGLGDGNLGEVVDVAGNITQCQEGAAIRKDTAPPVCRAVAEYKGIKS